MSIIKLLALPLTTSLLFRSISLASEVQQNADGLQSQSGTITFGLYIGTPTPEIKRVALSEEASLTTSRTDLLKMAQDGVTKSDKDMLSISVSDSERLKSNEREFIVTYW